MANGWNTRRSTLPMILDGRWLMEFVIRILGMIAFTALLASASQSQRANILQPGAAPASTENNR
jgi:hypothetical protein